jgi:hypothetical protein
MARRSLLATLLVLLLIPAFAFAAGGWAIITVEDVPDHLVALKPVEITFAVRQHGISLLGDLSPSVEARGAGTSTVIKARPAGQPGRYVARLVVPKAGEWTVTIHSGFISSKLVLLPMSAVASGAPRPAPLAAEDRGARLFVAKGCVGCHVHGMIDRPSYEVGPELTARRYPTAHLQRLLADPASVQGTGGGAVRMPNLGLRPNEIQSLVAFINADSPRVRR